MSIIFDSERRVFKLDTPASSYAFGISPAGYLFHYYYGASIPDTDLDYLRHRLSNASFSAYVTAPEEKGMSLDTARIEYPCEGTGDFRATALAIRGENGSSATDIRYKSYKIYAGKPALPGLPATYTNTDDEADTLEIVCEDCLTGAEITLVYLIGEELVADLCGIQAPHGIRLLHGVILYKAVDVIERHFIASDRKVAADKVKAFVNAQVRVEKCHVGFIAAG